MSNINQDFISRSQLYGIESLLMTDIVENNSTAKFVLEQVLYDIEHIEAADAAKVVCSRWILREDGYHCSNCDIQAIYTGVKLNYCPNCGAKMMN